MLSTTLQRYQASQQAKERGEETEEGFTLIELLIVIVVLGILAAVTVFALSGTTAKSAVAACNADAQTVNVALTASNVQNTPGTATISSLVSSGYLQSAPNSTHYAISISPATAGVAQWVLVQQLTPAVAAAQYPAQGAAANPCTGVL
jgi:prepilin-type N-terminal cleavage/methylation domain-containing protein